jgi:hypothetical protein
MGNIVAAAISLLMLSGACLADEAAALAKARAAVAAKLNDPDSAKYVDEKVIQQNGREIVCGRVNARNRFGGYDGPKPFLFDPAIKQGAIIYGGTAITDDVISGLARVQGFHDTCG